MEKIDKLISFLIEHCKINLVQDGYSCTIKDNIGVVVYKIPDIYYLKIFYVNEKSANKKITKEQFERFFVAYENQINDNNKNQFSTLLNKVLKDTEFIRENV